MFCPYFSPFLFTNSKLYTDPSLAEDSKVAENEAMCYESDKDITLYAKWKIGYGDGSTIDKAKLLTENGYFYTTDGSTMYFKFTATKSKTYTFSSSCLSDVDATLYSSSRVELSEDISYGDFYISHYLYAGETVYLRVIPFSGGIYSCTISVE